jgi:hypothetical protein
MKINKNRQSRLLFTEYHDSMINIERAYHNIGIAISLCEAINDRLEKTIVIFNSKTQAPIKAITLDGKTQWQIIREIVHEIPEEYGYEGPEVFPLALREFVQGEMKKKSISEIDISKKCKLSLSLVSYTLSGRRKSTYAMEAVATLLGYKSLDALIAASRGEVFVEENIPSTTDTLNTASRGDVGIKEEEQSNSSLDCVIVDDNRFVLQGVVYERDQSSGVYYKTEKESGKLRQRISPALFFRLFNECKKQISETNKGGSV